MGYIQQKEQRKHFVTASEVCMFVLVLMYCCQDAEKHEAKHESQRYKIHSCLPWVSCPGYLTLSSVMILGHTGHIRGIIPICFDSLSWEEGHTVSRFKYYNSQQNQKCWGRGCRTKVVLLWLLSLLRSRAKIKPSPLFKDPCPQASNPEQDILVCARHYNFAPLSRDAPASYSV